MDKLTLQKLRKWLEMRRDRSTSPYMETEGWRAYHSVLDYLDQHTTDPEPPVNIDRLIEWLKGEIVRLRVAGIGKPMDEWLLITGNIQGYEEALGHLNAKPTDPQTCKTCRLQACEYISGKPMDEWCLHHEPMDITPDPEEPGEPEEPDCKHFHRCANLWLCTSWERWPSKRKKRKPVGIIASCCEGCEQKQPTDPEPRLLHSYWERCCDEAAEEPVRERCGTCGYNNKTKFEERKELRYCSWHKYWFTNDSPCERWRPR